VDADACRADEILDAALSEHETWNFEPGSRQDKYGLPA